MQICKVCKVCRVRKLGASGRKRGAGVVKGVTAQSEGMECADGLWCWPPFLCVGALLLWGGEGGALGRDSRLELGQAMRNDEVNDEWKRRT